MPNYLVRRTGREWTFVLVDDQGETILKGGIHSVREFVLRTIEAVRFRSQEPGAYVMSETPSGRHAFKLLEADGRSIGISNFYLSAVRRDGVLEACRLHGCSAPIVDETVMAADGADGKVGREVGVGGGSAEGARRGVQETKAQEGAGLPARRSSLFSSLFDSQGAPGSAQMPREPAMPRFVIQTTGAGHTLLLVDEQGRRLMSALPCTVRAHCSRTAELIRDEARRAERFTKHLSDTGAHSFRLVDGSGNALATSRFYATAAERDEDIERCRRLAPIAVGPDAAGLPSVVMGERRGSRPGM
jgi:hypothetical protein